MFRIFSLLFLSLFVLIACNEESKKEKSEETAVVEESKKVEKNQEVVKGKAETEKEKVAALVQQQKNKEVVVLKIFQTNFDDIMEVTLDEDTKTFKFLSTDPEFISELYGLVSGTVDVAEWDFMVESFVDMSINSVEILGDGYGITIINPVNTDNYLLHIIDGIVVYDAFHE